MSWWQTLLISFGGSVTGGFVGALVYYRTFKLATKRAAREEEQRLGLDPEHDN